MKIYGDRFSFHQWDVNQKITSPKLKEGDEVHFGNAVTGEALTVEAYRLGAAVVADIQTFVTYITTVVKKNGLELAFISQILISLTPPSTITISSNKIFFSPLTKTGNSFL